MSQAPHTTPPGTDWDEVAARGQEYYEQQLRTQLEPAHRDEFVVIDVDTGDYFLGATDQEVLTVATARRPGARLYLARVGRAAAIRLRRVH